MPDLFEPQAPSQDRHQELVQKFREIFGAYDQVLTSEPVIEIIEPGVSWVINAQHGPTLVSKNMAILDVDYNGSLAELKATDKETALDTFEAALVDVAMPTDSFRVYRTFKGFRLIYTKAIDASEFQRLLKRFGEAVGVDPRYGLACLIRKAFHARLKPKSPQMRREFLDQDAGLGERRACKYIGTINDNGRIPCSSITAQIRFHDQETEALSDSELFTPKELF